ncbi:hypothetical protein DICPUDRAFT_39887 [Dictyostelium purpureum]|uniref:ADP-ribosylglycohydrolase n=1 Tax=Dictyostelium purpureum TaxID=5786 RepID=F0ZX70_DICPU|nr:uncharacterized protein DICPUDRAFT_39887 [Dictyostelium purpureum]EGC31470.1 hypothetical protein DICPUDRAFT_39887 [Dictyostelium purpureum]|eukprot:XP_003292009.1 hypothetical protein DICPUDRAFT_39887 [Dictyostelium purpureum]
MDRYNIAGLDKNLLEDPFYDRILGCIYGSVLGDAYGLATELLNKDQIIKIYGTSAIPFPSNIRTSNSCRWVRGDWTDESDQMILVMESIIENNGKVDEVHFAKKLQKWVIGGFSELGDSAGIGSSFTSIVLQPQFTSNPLYVSEKNWVTSGRRSATNGCLPRSTILGAISYDKLQNVIANSSAICKVTHYDQRCIISSNVLALSIAMLLNNAATKKILSLSSTSDRKNEEVDNVIEEVVKGACSMLSGSIQERVEFEEIIYNTSLDSLNLSYSDSLSYVFKALGAGFWGLRSNYSFKDTLNLVIREGEWLDQRVVKFIDIVKKNKKE